ncbi:MAG: gamma-glutamylcyclotransferase [Burkholderiales bacterium]|nr:gamma-glutamylcyclotransferase [Burkholderiales bacterium]
MSASGPGHPAGAGWAPLPHDDPFHYSRLDLPRDELWIFTYGSLMWDPAFRFEGSAPALLRGYHRAFCIYSSRYRGTASAPGLVLGLDRGGACRGRAYRVAAADIPEALEALWLREMRRRVYVPRLLPVDMGGERRMALAFLANRRHDGYAGRLGLEAAAAIIAARRGERGPNVDYLVNTLRHLDALGVHDRHLHDLLAAVRARGAR